MRYTSEQYEDKIEHARIFEMARTEENKDEYDAEERRFFNILFEYEEQFGAKAKDAGDGKYYCKLLHFHSAECFTAAKGCVKNYDGSGLFLNYFHSAVATEIRRESKRQQIRHMRQGGTIGKSEQIIQKYIKYVESKNGDLNDTGLQSGFAEAFNVDLNELREAIVLNDRSKRRDSKAFNRDGDEIDLLKNVADERALISDTTDEDEEKIFVDKLKELEKVYADLGNRESVKRVFRMTVTARIVKEFGADESVLKTIADVVSFWEERVEKYFAENGKIPSDRIMAEWCGAPEESFNRNKKKRVEPALDEIMK